MTGAALAACVICICAAIASYARMRTRLKATTFVNAVVESFDAAPGAVIKGTARGESSFRRYRLRLPEGDSVEAFGYGAHAVGDHVEIARGADGSYALRADVFRGVIWWIIGAAVSAAIAVAAYFNLP